MKDISRLGFHMTCPLVQGIIDSDLCIEVQDCIEGSIPITIELEEFLESEGYQKKCRECKYHI